MRKTNDGFCCSFNALKPSDNVDLSVEMKQPQYLVGEASRAVSLLVSSSLLQVCSQEHPDGQETGQHGDAAADAGGTA